MSFARLKKAEERIWIETKAVAAGFAWADHVWARYEVSGLELEPEFPGAEAEARLWAARISPDEVSFFADGCLARARSRWAELWRRSQTTATAG